MKQLFFFIIILSSFFIANAQTGGIKGKVISSEDGTELIGASVYIIETSKGAMVDMDGNYLLNNIEPGAYKLVCSYISYVSDTVGISIKAGQISVHNFSLRSSAIAINAFTVEAKAIKNSENYMLQIKQKSATVMEGITAQEITKRGDRNAASAVKRVTGITIEGGKYVYVRGLSDRYSKTTLNKAEIPGLDPNRNAVQLDLFPSNMIENMTIIKSFTPDLPGSFTGGLIDIETRDFPEKFTFQFSSSISYNTQTTFNSEYLKQEGSSTDWLGYDNGFRDLPSRLNNSNYLPSLYDINDKDREKLMLASKSLNKVMEPVKSPAPLNHALSFSVGDNKLLFGRELGYILGFSYTRNFTHIQKDAKTIRYDITGNIENTNELTMARELTDTKSSDNVLWGGLVNVSYKFSPNHKIGLTGLINKNGISSSSFQEGPFPGEDEGLFFQNRELAYQERMLSTQQIKGEHYFQKLAKTKVDWLASRSISQLNEPDLRNFSNDFRIDANGDTTYSINGSAYPLPTRFYRTLEQQTLDGKINFSTTIFEKNSQKSFIKYGGSYVTQSRSFKEKRLSYVRAGKDVFDGNVTAYFSDENMTFSYDTLEIFPLITELNGLYIQDASETRNTYTANQQFLSGYLMGDIWATKKLRLITGARYETTNINVVSKDSTLREGIVAQADILPSVNIAYALTEKSNIRVAYTKTLARPTFREIAPFATYDFATGWVLIGNDSLQRTLINNFDIRYELFPKMGELISISAFYKVFENPIELVFNTKAANAELTWRNQDYAFISGFEFEVKKELPFISDSINKFLLGGNFTYIYSEVQIDGQELIALKSVNPNASPVRQMFGQSPYIINGFLEYKNDSLRLGASLSYNIFGPRIAVVFANGLPNVFDQPVHQIDLNIFKSLSQKFNLRVGVQNILDPLFKQTHTYKGAEYIFNSYRLGRTITLGFSYTI